jgi:hypothetical protein
VDQQHEESIMMNPQAVDFCRATPFWASHREVTLNWLALGLLLAAWNAADHNTAPGEPRKPDSLRAHSQVSMRALQRATMHSPS